MKGYKGFNKGLICRSKQYTENTIFEEPEANICESGMHFCKNPLDVLDDYGFVSKNGELNEFAEVEALDEVETNDDRKFCTKKLKIGAKLSLVGFVKACVEFVTEKTTVTQTVSKISSKKIYSKVSSMEIDSTVASTGYASKVSSMGVDSTVVSTGIHSKVSSMGIGSTVASTGDESTIVSTGYDSKVASTGDESTVISTGDTSTVVSAGDTSTVVSTGDKSAVVSTRDKSTVISTGACATVVSEGDDCIICCVGAGSCVKAKRGNWITLTEWKYDEQSVSDIPVLKTEYVDGERIKEDVFYVLKDGKFQEVET